MPRRPRATSAPRTSTARAAARSTTTSSPAPTPALPTFRGRASEVAAGPREVPQGQEGPHRPLRAPRRRRDRRRRSLGPLRPGGPDAQARAASTWSRSSSGRSASATRSRQGTVDSNEIWVELIAAAGRPGRSAGRAASAPDGDGRPVVALHQRLHARPRRQPDRPPQPAGHLHPALQQADPARARARSSTSGSTSPRPDRARSRSRRRSTTASSTASTWTTSSARGRGPSCRSSSWRRTRSRCRSRAGRPSSNEPSPIKDGVAALERLRHRPASSKAATRAARRAS